jgi:ComF family protein
LDCKSLYPVFQKGFSPLAYEGEGAKAVNLYKNGKRYLSRLFAELMKARFFEEVGEFSSEEGCIYYVPLTKAKEKLRGYNQAEELAKEFSLLTGIPWVKDGVQKVRETKPQKGMTAKERADNVKAVFRVHKRKECRGKRVILIDDIMTRGATGNEISRILLLAGAKEVLFLTIASVPEM